MRQAGRREALVDAAFREIAGRGFEGLRTRDVAAEVGVNVSTLHYYFPTKESLIRGVVEHAMDRFRSTLEPHGSPADQLRNHLRAVRKLMTTEPELGVVMGELALRANRDSSVREIVDEMYSTWHKAMRGLLRRAAQDGRLRPELDNDATAALIMGTLMSVTLGPNSAGGRGEQAVRQLERLLGISPSIN
jgi:AcrR family transcriptional regulator